MPCFFVHSLHRGDLPGSSRWRVGESPWCTTQGLVGAATQQLLFYPEGQGCSTQRLRFLRTITHDVKERALHWTPFYRGRGYLQEASGDSALVLTGASWALQNELKSRPQKESPCACLVVEPRDRPGKPPRRRGAGWGWGQVQN